MRLGGKVFRETRTPREWVAAHRELGYRAAYCPVSADDDDETIDAYVRAANEADIVIAEVHAWSNPIARSEQARRRSIDKCIRQLRLADRIGARCCVNIPGSRGAKHNGPSPDNVTGETFDLIVETVREIIDAARPTRSVYSLEALQWCIPDGPESYLELLEAIDRDGFGVHLDPVNMVNSPRRFYENGRLICECFEMLGPHIRSVHAKDVTMDNRPLVHLDECRPGTGGLDYVTFLRQMDRLPADTPLMLEHLPDAEEYARAAEYIRTIARQEGIEV
jgi:sugar phosphate isomerase/epimerase